MSDSSAAPLVEVSGVSKSFPGVRALDSISLSVRAGEVVGLVGENGAGKSTLIRVLAGAHQPDSGQILVDGFPVRFSHPVAAMRAGIGVIYQEFNLIPGLTAVENLFLGREAWRINHRSERDRAQSIFERLGVFVPLDVPCSRLSVAQQQIVEVARALVQDARLLIMDEPTAALTPQEVGRLLEIVRELKSQEIGILYVSHRLNEIFEICDTVTVLRDGGHVATRPVSEVSRDSLIEHMVGRAITSEYPSRNVKPGPVRLSASGLTRRGAINNVSLKVRSGELLGITGLVGSGRTELLRLLFGADQADAGEVHIDGEPLDLSSPRRAIRAGLCLLTEDRKHEGLVLRRSVLENFSLASLPSFSLAGFVNDRRERTAFASHVEFLRIRIASADQLASGLSGGN